MLHIQLEILRAMPSWYECINGNSAGGVGRLHYSRGGSKKTKKNSTELQKNKEKKWCRNGERKQKWLLIKEKTHCRNKCDARCEVGRFCFSIKQNVSEGFQFYENLLGVVWKWLNAWLIEFTVNMKTKNGISYNCTLKIPN